MPRTIVELLARARERFAGRPFLCEGAGPCEFGAFVADVDQLAAGLLLRGVGRGDRVVVLLPRGADAAVALLAAMRVGALAVPVHDKLKDDQVRHIVDDSAPRLVVTAAARTVGLRDADDLLRERTVVTVADLRASGERVADVDVDAADPAVLLYTSGSTGRAKGIVQTHQNLCLGARVVSDYLALGERDHVLGLLSFSFDYGLNQLLSSLYSGCRLTVAQHLGVGELAGLLQRHRPTGLAGVPSLWHEVAVGLGSGALRDDDGASLRYVTNSGGALRPVDARVLRERWPHVQVFAMYGLTEAFRSAFLPPDEYDAHPDSFGYAIDGVELLLVDPDGGHVLDGPATGELVHAGALVADGYWSRPDDDARRFRDDPRGIGGRVVYSGDLVRRDADGRHYFVSRLDGMLKVQGHRVSPDEVAQAVVGIPGTGEVCVLGVDGGADGHRVALFYAGDPADEALHQLVRRRCRARLPSYMQPSIVRPLPALPHNANGKVDAAALRALLDDGTAAP